MFAVLSKKLSRNFLSLHLLKEHISNTGLSIPYQTHMGSSHMYSSQMYLEGPSELLHSVAHLAVSCKICFGFWLSVVRWLVTLNHTIRAHTYIGKYTQVLSPLLSIPYLHLLFCVCVSVSVWESVEITAAQITEKLLKSINKNKNICKK